MIAWYLPQLNQTQHAVTLAERALRLNPNYPAWYNQGFRYVYFTSRAFDKTVKFVKLVPNPNPLDYAFLAMASAMLNETDAAKSAAAELRQRDVTWTIEAYLSDNGGVPEQLADLFIGAARKASVPVCATLDKVNENPGFMRLLECDAERTKGPAKTSAAALPSDSPPR